MYAVIRNNIEELQGAVQAAEEGLPRVGGWQGKQHRRTTSLHGEFHVGSTG